MRVLNSLYTIKKTVASVLGRVNFFRGNTYNELGQLVDKKLHSKDNGSTFKQSVDYRYNIRGWLSSMNNSSLVNDGGATNDDTNDLFGMNLLYNQTDAGLGNAVQYNGNISAIKWNNFLGQASVKERGYIFSYDALNRLLAANHRERTASWAASSSFHENGLGYDLNGNITTLARKGAAGLNMDQLTYAYSGNRLQTVADAGDITKGFADGNVGSTDYTYDVKGNMTVDKNKGITAITYNHLNLPVQVTRNTGEYARFSYDAGGVKLCESFYNSANVLTKQLDYVGDYFYQNDSLKQISHTDGRVVMTPQGGAPEYQYTLKDHLGNSRVTFTAKMETDAATGTYEPTNATAEQSKFVRYENAKRINSTLFDRTNGAAPGYSQRLNGSANEKYGLARSLSVMPGDVINAEVYAKYVDPVTSNWNTALTTLMGNIASSAAGVVIDGANYTTSTASFPANYPGLVTKTDNGAPKAYLNWLIFDRNYAFLNGGFQQISTACRETGTDVAHERLASPTITITQPGYVYIYVSNDNPTQTEVFFDDLSVSQTKSPIVSTDDYTPFGLTFNSFQRESSFANRWKFQEQERITEMGLNWDSFKWRNHQPEIGRFFNIDPLAEKYYYNSPYAFSENKVTGHRELEGLEAESILRNEVKKVENVYNNVAYDVKTTTNNVINSVVNYVKGLFAKDNGEIKNVVGVNEKQTDPQATDKSWLGGTDPQFNSNAKAKQVESNDGIVMQTEGGMKEVEGTGSNANDTKVQDVSNQGTKDKFDTLFQTVRVETGGIYQGVIQYNTITVIKNEKDTVIKSQMDDKRPIPPIKK